MSQLPASFRRCKRLCPPKTRLRRRPGNDGTAQRCERTSGLSCSTQGGCLEDVHEGKGWGGGGGQPSGGLEGVNVQGGHKSARTFVVGGIKERQRNSCRKNPRGCSSYDVGRFRQRSEIWVVPDKPSVQETRNVSWTRSKQRKEHPELVQSGREAGSSMWDMCVGRAMPLMWQRAAGRDKRARCQTKTAIDLS